MGKKNKEKNSKVKGGNQNKKPNAKSQNKPKQGDVTISTVASRISQDQTLQCGVCHNTNVNLRWFVMCDKCNGQFHFECVGFTKEQENDPWSCVSCQHEEPFNKVNKNQPSKRMSSNIAILSQKPSHVIVPAVIHAPPIDTRQSRGSIPDQNGQEIVKSTSAVTPVDYDAIELDTTSATPNVKGSQSAQQISVSRQVTFRSNVQSTDTNVGGSPVSFNNRHQPSTSSIISKPLSRSSKSTSSSHHRKQMEIDRLKLEFEMNQQFVDNKLALQLVEIAAKREANLAKEQLQKNFTQEMFNVMLDTDVSSAGSSSKHSRTSHSRRSIQTSRSTLVEDWIKDQQKQYQRSSKRRDDNDAAGEAPHFEVSIPIDPSEWQEMYKLNDIKPLNPNASEFNLTTKVPEESGINQLTTIVNTMERNLNEYTTKSSQIGQQSNPLLNSTEDGQQIPVNSRSHSKWANHPGFSTVNQTGYWTNSNGYTKRSTMIPPDNQSSGREIPVISQGPMKIKPVRHIIEDDPSSINQNHQNVTTMPSNRQQAENDFTTLSRNQIAARHAITKDLPKFSGNVNEWDRFINRFERSTRLCGYSNDENLERLEKCLEGNAEKMVQSLLNSPSSVPRIIEKLQKRYGRPEVILESMLDELQNEPCIKPDKLEALSQFGYKVSNTCDWIESKGLNAYLYSPKQVRDLLVKLPHERKIEWARYSQGLRTITFKAFAEWMCRLSESIDLISTPEVVNSVNNSERKSENSKSGHVHVHDNASQISAGKISQCVICSKECKNVGECSKFKSLNVDERWKLKAEHKLCRKCLKKHDRICKDKKFEFCGVSGCNIKHHPLLHNSERHFKVQPAVSNDTVKVQKTSTAVESVNAAVVKGGSHTHHDNNQDALFRIVPVKLYFNGRSVTTFAFLDDGSYFTLMERRIANMLDLKGVPETICLIWTNNVHRQESSECVQLEISGTNESSTKYQIRQVNIVEDLGLPSQSVLPQVLAERFEYLKDIPLEEYSNAVPTIMIGLKNARLAAPLETIEGGENDLIATRSRLGWTVHGPLSENGSTGYVNFHRQSKCPCTDRDEDLHRIVKDHFSIESFGVQTSSMSVDSKENDKALGLLEKFTIRKGNRFETRLLWKNEAYILPDSYGMAFKRMTCLENKGPEIIKIMDEFIENYMNKGYASKLTPAEMAIEHPRTFYLPIFTVTNPKKPDKLRPVFDGAAKIKGVSLNSTLLTGPDLLSPMVNVLRRFRENPIAVSGDIKEMYHQVQVTAKDRHAQRFIWRSGDKSRKPDVYQMNVLPFGLNCSPTSAQYVKNKNAADFSEKYPRAVKSIIDNHYVDDMMDGAESVKQTIELVKNVKFIHSQAGFEIRNFKSNSKEVLDAIGENSKENKKVILEDENQTERVLGMFWDTVTDCFVFSLKFTKVTKDMMTGRKLPTKRELLKLVMSIFDPLGLIAYYLIHAKILLQDVWRSKIAWDEQLPENLYGNWFRWIELLPKVETLEIPRWYSKQLSSQTRKTELHIFVDGGGDAYSAVAYLRTEDETGCECSLIGSKARVTPMKYLSTPRIELTGAVLGSRLMNSICDGLSIKTDRQIIWTDSATVLIWLHSEHRKYSQFVAHRVGEILENTNLNQWRWVPTKLNVADEATKWTKNPTFNFTDRWFQGPEFLKLSEHEWPIQKAIQPNGTHEEMKLSCTHSRLILPSIIDSTRFSNYKRMHRAVTYAIRFSLIILSKIRNLEMPSGSLSQEELQLAEQKIFCQAQWEGFPEEMVTLVRNQTLEPEKQKSIDKNSPIKDCLPYLDEMGILRVSGRIDAATAVTLDAKRPIILPRKHWITKLIVRRYHIDFKHQNHETVINELKQRFYIPQIRTVLKGVRWSCARCEIRRCKPSPPQMADLPSIRFETGIRPYTYTGVDYFGPMYVKMGRQQHKRWGVLFTCLTIRAIYIEIAHTMDANSCIMAIRNFKVRNGCPSHFFSDNGTNLKGANTELKKELEKLDWKALSDYFTTCYTKWTYIPPASPHMGGCWERLIRSVKSCLEESMPTRTPTDEALKNLLIESENIVNSRPLTFIPIDSEESEALTPNHFVLGSSNGLKSPGNFRTDGPYLRDAWKEVQRCTEKFWERFIREYVPTLTRRTKWFDKVKPLEVGDIVLCFDGSNPRNTYPRARIVETFIGSKGQVRRAKIQNADGSTLWRPATKLGLLDVQRSNSSSDAPTKENLDHTSHTIEIGGRNVGAQASSAVGSKSACAETLDLKCEMSKNHQD